MQLEEAENVQCPVAVVPTRLSFCLVKIFGRGKLEVGRLCANQWGNVNSSCGVNAETVCLEACVEGGLLTWGRRQEGGGRKGSVSGDGGGRPLVYFRIEV